MKKTVLILVTCILLVTILSSCNGQLMAKDFGGSYELKLEPGYKLIEITWKDGEQLWYLVRPFEDGEEPTTYYFKESSGYGLIEGEIIIIESEKKEEKETNERTETGSIGAP